MPPVSFWERRAGPLAAYVLGVDVDVRRLELGEERLQVFRACASWGWSGTRPCSLHGARHDGLQHRVQVERRDHSIIKHKDAAA